MVIKTKRLHRDSSRTGANNVARKEARPRSEAKETGSTMESTGSLEEVSGCGSKVVAIEPW